MFLADSNIFQDQDFFILWELPQTYFFRPVEFYNFLSNDSWYLDLIHIDQDQEVISFKSNYWTFFDNWILSIFSY